MHSEQRIGVLLVNTGSPDEPTPRAVRAYLSAMLSDSRLIHNINMLVWRSLDRKSVV